MLMNSNSYNYYTNMDSRYNNEKGANQQHHYSKSNNGYYTNSRSTSRNHSPNTLLQAAHSPDSIAMQHNDYHHSKQHSVNNQHNKTHHRRSNSKHDTCTCLQCIEKEYEEAVKFQQQAARKIYNYVDKKQQQQADDNDNDNDDEQDDPEEDDDSFSESYDEELGLSESTDYYSSSILDQETALAQAQAQAQALHIQQQAKLQAEYYRKQQEQQQQYLAQQHQRALQHQQQQYALQHARTTTASQAHAYAPNKALDLPQNRTASQPATTSTTVPAKPGVRITIHEEPVDNLVRAAEVPVQTAAVKEKVVKAEPVKFKWSKRHILRSMSTQNTNHNIRHWSTFPAPTTRIFNRMEVAQCIKACRPKSAPNSRKSTPSSTPKSTSRSIKSPPSTNANVAYHYHDENSSASDWNAKKSKPVVNNSNGKEQQWERELQQNGSNTTAHSNVNGASKLAPQRSNSAHHLQTRAAPQQSQQQQATRRSASTSHLPVNGSVPQQHPHQQQQVVPVKSSHYYSSMAPGMTVATAAVKTMQMQMAMNGAATGTSGKPVSRPSSATRQQVNGATASNGTARVMKAYGQLPKL